VQNVLPEFASDPVLRATMLAWAPVEEIDEETTRLPLLKKFHEKMQLLDP
jgi:hypothetical protein